MRSNLARFPQSGVIFAETTDKASLSVEAKIKKLVSDHKQTLLLLQPVSQAVQGDSIDLTFQFKYRGDGDEGLSLIDDLASSSASFLIDSFSIDPAKGSDVRAGNKGTATEMTETSVTLDVVVWVQSKVATK